jgi:hypothetical protein
MLTSFTVHVWITSDAPGKNFAELLFYNEIELHDIQMKTQSVRERKKEKERKRKKEMDRKIVISSPCLFFQLEDASKGAFPNSILLQLIDNTCVVVHSMLQSVHDVMPLLKLPAETPLDMLK